MRSFKKKIFLSILAIFLAGSQAKASNDILEEIGKGLEKPKLLKEKKPYLENLFRAMINKDSYILYKELYLAGRYSFDLGKIEGRNSAGFILFGTFSGPEGQIGDMNVQFRTAYY